MPQQDGEGQGVGDCLDGDAPVGETSESACDADAARHGDGDYHTFAALFDHEVAEEIARRGGSEGADKET